MISYTLDDVRKLGGIDQEEEDRTELAIFDYNNLLEEVIKEKKTPEASLMEYIGAYHSIVYDPTTRELLMIFLFKVPVDDMPKYMNDSGDLAWRSKLSRWRMAIGK